MKTTTLMASMLVAAAAAGIAPQIPTFVKSAFNPAAVIQTAPQGNSPVQIGWPTSSQPIFLHRDGANYTMYLPLQNTSSAPQCVSIQAKVRRADGSELKATITPEQLLIPESTSISKQITLTPESFDGPGTGYLNLYAARPKIDTSAATGTAADSCTLAEKGTPIYQALRIPEEPWMGKIFLSALLTTILVVFITMINLRRQGISLFHLMGAPNWSFEKSWGANVTLGGALLMTLLGLTIFPDHPRLMAKTSYTFLQIIFGALVSLAPLVYNLIHRDVQVNNNGITQVTSQGYVLFFLIAGAIVLWAAMGQVATLGILIQEFVSSGVLDEGTGYALESLAALLFVLLLVYGLRSLYRTPKNVSATPVAAAGVMPGPRPAAAAGLPSPMAEWSIL